VVAAVVAGDFRFPRDGEENVDIERYTWAIYPLSFPPCVSTLLQSSNCSDMK